MNTSLGLRALPLNGGERLRFGSRPPDLPTLGFVAVGLVAIVAYVLVPDVDDALYLVVGGAASLAILGGVIRNRPGRPGWLLIGIGVIVYMLGDSLYTYLAATTQTEPFPSPADALYLIGELMFVCGIAALVERDGERSLFRPALLDAALVATAGGFVVWAVLLDPIIDTATEPAATAIAVAYPMIDIVLVGVLTRHLLVGGRRSTSALLLMLGVAGWLVADVLYARLSLTGDYVSGSIVDTGWLLGYVLFGAAALHPSMVRLVIVSETHETAVSNRRLALVGLSLAIPVLVLVLHGPFVHQGDYPGFVTGSVILTTLGSARLLGSIRDVRVAFEHQRSLRHEIDRRSRTDDLTGLVNRAALRDLLDQALGGEAAALLFLDLDDFKRVNDTFGHPVGDALLSDVAARLLDVVREPDAVARLGGDEFAILISACPDRATAARVAGRVLGSFSSELEVAGHSFRVRPSIGVVWARRGELSADEVLSRADIAMYLAKNRGGGTFEMFVPEMHDRAMDRLRLRDDLERAVDRREIVPFYQPIFDSRDLRLVAVEALARWRHPVRGLGSPADFVPLAEVSGLIADLDRAMIAMATRDAATWNDVVGGTLALHVNISPREAADPAMPDVVARCLEAAGLSPARLVVEVTETALAEEETVRPVLERLKDLGVRLSIDDFGSRYAVLAQLGRLPIDIVKLDRSLVQGAATPEGLRLLQGVVRLAETLRLETVAEGVETTAELALLRRLGFDALQGFALARPMPAADIVARLPDWTFERAASA